MSFADMSDIVIAIVTASLASSGMWAFFQSRADRKDRSKCQNSALLELTMGIAHDRIIHIGKGYIDRGWITFDEYEDFQNYLYGPYEKVGGNGMARKVYESVSQLPIRSSSALPSERVNNE